jgi:hypothetical protein
MTHPINRRNRHAISRPKDEEVDEVYIKPGRGADSLPENDAEHEVLRSVNIRATSRVAQLLRPVSGGCGVRP